MFILESIREYFFNSHLKINTAISILAFVPFFAVSFSSTTLPAGSIANGITTHIKVSCYGESHSFDTKSNTVSGSLEGTPCALADFDTVKPERDTKLNGETVNIEVIKAVSVTVVDNGATSIIKSAYNSPREILAQHQVEINPEDRIKTELVLSDFDINGMGQKIVIERAPVINVEADGQSSVVRSWKKTVGEILTERGIPMGPKDEISPKLDTQVSDGIKVTIRRINEIESAEDEAIPFGTVSEKDYNIHQGQSRVKVEGQNGVRKRSFRVTYVNGVVSGRVLISEAVVKPPVTKVVVEGVKPYSHQDLWAIMVEAGARYKVDPSAMFRVMLCESGGRVNAVNGGGYKGLFQWDGTFYKYTAMAGVPADYFNPRSQIFATAARVHATGGWRAWSCKP